jgi:uncharacterized YigZ family protein
LRRSAKFAFFAVMSYHVPATRHRVEQVIDRSRFICTLDRAESPEAAQQFIREMNAEFPDATHNCWAYVTGGPGSTSRIGMSDAGEPHGTAGRPMLTILLHSNVGEIAAVVTRYYGGVKLGTGGLVKAYSGAVKLALESLPLTERVDAVIMELTIGHADIHQTRQLLATLGASIEDQQLAADVRYRVSVPRTKVTDLQRELAELSRGAATMREVTHL